MLGGRGFLLSHGRFTTIDRPGSRFTVPSRIDDRGRIVGGYGDPNRDNGRGFLLEATHADMESPHWGLVTMRERAAAIGGRCTIDTSPGRGTRVTVEVPR